jgi:HSP20 family protein
MSRWQVLDPFWNPVARNSGTSVWNQLRSIQDEMNRLFSRWGGDGNREFGFSATFPALNVWEDADSVYIEAELPGVDQKDLEIFVTGGNQFTLKGQRNLNVPEKAIWHRQERGTGSFVRSLTLPFNVNQDKVDARLENGVLKVKLAKHEEAKPRKIVVKGE